ncbi:MAG: GNAT family N-acetyltransferase [Planctomycetes bacterium]|nr:GNAT family N-acetyltransferase [Planctomycetota bacterium]
MSIPSIDSPAPATAVIDLFRDRASAVEVRLLSLDEWQGFVEAQPDSTVFHHRNWIDMLVSQYGGRLVIPAATCDDRIVTAIPFLETRGLLGKRKLVSLPFSDYVPLLWSNGIKARPADFSSAQETALQAIQSFLKSETYRHYQAIIVRSPAPLGDAPCESHWFRHVIDVNRPYDAILAGFNQSARRNQRLAESKGMNFEIRTDRKAMEIFYALHVMTRQKLGVPVQPKSFFLKMHEKILAQGLGFVAVVMKDDRPAAAAVFLTYKQSMIYKYGASCPGMLEHRPNELLFGRAIRWASEHHYRLFEMGVSDKEQEGLCSFKRKLGAVESKAYHVFLAGTPQPMMQQWRVRQLVTGIIQRSPAFVCRGIGKLLYRYSQ